MTSERRSEQLAGDLLAQRDGCPDADQLQCFLEQTLPKEEADRIGSHLEKCEPCRAAVSSFRAGDGEADETSSDIKMPTDVEARSEALIESVTDIASGEIHAGWWPAVLKVAAGITFLNSVSLAAYVWVGEGAIDQGLGQLRSSRDLEPASPAGEVSATPRVMRWSPHPLADSYRVLLFSAEMEQIWSAETAGGVTELQFDEAGTALLSEGDWFTWQVLALDHLGGEVARSPAAHFRIVSGQP